MPGRASAFAVAHRPLMGVAWSWEDAWSGVGGSEEKAWRMDDGSTQS